MLFRSRALEVGVGIVLGAIVRVLGMGMLGREFFQPLFKIAVQAGLVVIDENARRDVHGVNKAESLADAALAQAGLDLRGDIHKRAAAGDFEPEFLPVGFHGRNDYNGGVGGSSFSGQGRLVKIERA